METVIGRAQDTTELMALLRRLSTALPELREGSAELRDAHANLQNIRGALVKPILPPPRP